MKIIIAIIIIILVLIIQKIKTKLFFEIYDHTKKVNSK